MKRTVTIITLCVGCVIAANAQTFTQRLQKVVAGMGKVTVTQSAEIDDLVNGTQNDSAKKTDEKTATAQQNEKTTARFTIPRDTTSASDSADLTPGDNRKKVMRGGIKVNGYRVQVFAGGNQRKDRQLAEKTGNELKTLFPSQPIYVHFYSPRWICRMGNYRTYEEAHQILLSVRKAGYGSATIIKDKITVYH